MKKSNWVIKRAGFRFKLFFDGERTTVARLDSFNGNSISSENSEFTSSIQRHVWDKDFVGIARKSENDEFNIKIAVDVAIKKAMSQLNRCIVRDIVDFDEKRRKIFL